MTVPPLEGIAAECMVMVGALVAIQPGFKTRGEKATVLKSMMKMKMMGRQVGDIEQLHPVPNVRQRNRSRRKRLRRICSILMTPLKGLPLLLVRSLLAIT